MASSEVAQMTPAPENHPGAVPKSVGGGRVAWGGAGMSQEPVPGVSSPWGAATTSSVPSLSSPSSFRDLMSEDLAKDLEEKENEALFRALVDPPDHLGTLLAPQNDTSNDLILAQMVQYEFDREYDQQVQREEKIYNGNSKVSVSFNKFKLCPSWYGPDSEDELQDIDDEFRAIDSFEEREKMDPVIPPCGYVKQGTRLITKHDLAIAGRKNAERFMNMPPGVNTGDGGGFDMHLSNKVYNKLCRSALTEVRRKQRVHDKVEKATTEMALDPRTRLLIFKLVNNAVLDSVNGVVSAGKEAVVFHAKGGQLEDRPIPADCAMKVFKTTLTDFKTRERYIKDDYRFRDRLSKNNTPKLIQLWAEKEYHNLRRLQKAEIPAPDPILIKQHILLMSFIGVDQIPAPKLKEVRLSAAELSIAYEQVVEAMVKMFHGCHLVHADLSEYNILWYEGKCWIIDLGQAVEPTHPHALHFLHRDCTNIIRFFQSKGLSKLPSPLQLFKKVSGISLPGPEESAPRMIEEYETHQELWREGVNSVSDQFEFLWQEIQKEEKQKKGVKLRDDDEDDDDDGDDDNDEGNKEEEEEEEEGEKSQYPPKYSLHGRNEGREREKEGEGERERERESKAGGGQGSKGVSKKKKNKGRKSK